MDIERELEILINKHKGKQVGLGEIRLDWFAEDCLKEIRRLKSEIARQSVASEEVQEAIADLEEAERIENRIYYSDNVQKSEHELNIETIWWAIAALHQYQPWVSVDIEKPESEKPVLLLCEVRPIGRKYICVGFYAKPKSVIIPCDDESNYEYDEETDEYYLIEGFYENIYNWCDYTSVAISDFVIGWKPLPPKGE